MLLSIPVIRKRRPRARLTSPNPEPPVAPLTLIAATYNDGDPSVTLTFDRAVDVSGIEAEQITVKDQVNACILQGNGAVLVDPNIVSVGLAVIDAYAGTGELLSATSETGIVAQGDGATWAGVTDLEMPFP